MYILNFIRGFCMALADSVPGVSGGTIAFILGFYDNFVNSLNNIISGDKIGRINALKFLTKIGVGWVVGFILSVLFITTIFEKNIYEINSLFLGFIIASIPIIVKSEKKTLLSNNKNIIFLIIGIIVVCGITYFNPITSKGHSFSVRADNLSLAFGAYIFISGMIAISAMVLPGISGSTILLIFGLYTPILNAIKQVLKFNFEYLPSIIIFGFGILAGIFLTVRTVRSLLRKFRAQTIYCIIGLMIGSIYAVIMGPTSLEIPKPPMNPATFSIVFFAIGCTLVPALEKLKVILEKKNIESITT
ncbi:DUF368 domain-containing protein [Romboutsia ilealis]|uniref:DUF368 domain-containing protein n=2 Tax=Romboutsia faecis TaxID=2764597 RepID=A0ABR7JLK8_9FIRM|nr:DUF368 domain-containing protein [Romboutsia faecis]MBC5995815.1 DUF368 domain-containing protein [Romboutsia faecis]MRN23014.1 DUF368 domain-containing protein [Romboutsia ilealis]